MITIYDIIRLYYNILSKINFIITDKIYYKVISLNLLIKLVMKNYTKWLISCLFDQK